MCFDTFYQKTSVFLFWVSFASAQRAQPAPFNPSNEKVGIMRSSVKAINDRIDRVLAREKLPYNPTLNDFLFARRVYVDLTGTIPTYEQLVHFANDKRPSKRTYLINKLLASEGYVSHTFNYFADLLRIQTKMTGGESASERFSGWLKDSIHQDKPYNRLVFEMISSSGSIRENPATGYHLRDKDMKLDHVAFMTKVFLAKDIACAQCHDHPSDDWTQKQYYAFASYLGELEIGQGQDLAKDKDRKMVFAEKRKIFHHPRFSSAVRSKYGRTGNTAGKVSQFHRDFKKLAEGKTLAVFDDDGSNLPLPDDYQYDDAEPGDLVKPAFIVGRPLGGPRNVPLREQLAFWLANPQNGWFSLAIANRMWARYLGRGVAEPLHNVELEKASDPMLLKTLSEVMVALEFDLRAFSWVVLHTKAYNRMGSRIQLEERKPYHFPGPVLRRMSAAQIWDSILTLAVQDIDERPGDVTGGRGYDYDKFNEYMDMNADALFTLVKESADVMVRRREFDNKRKEIERDMRQARNSKNTSEENKLKSDMQDLRKQYSDLLDMRKKQREQNKGKVDDDPRWRGVPRDMVRASEMEQPARPGHFLRMFGQSDREITNNGYDDSSIPQILSLMNGTLFQRIMRRDSILLEQVKKAGSGRDKLETVWVSILTRKPTASETSLVQSELRDVAKDEAFQDIVWALLNTREFMFVQ